MKKSFQEIVLLLLPLLFSFSCIMSCGIIPGGGDNGGGGGGLISPIWISARWTGGASTCGGGCSQNNGQVICPNDRKDVVPDSILHGTASYCDPTATVELTHNTATLNIYNHCAGTAVDYFICATSGGPNNSELKSCATNPLQTNVSNLTPITLTTGCDGDWVNATGDLSIQMFYCAIGQQLVGPGLGYDTLGCI